jgi:hypothetical protein
LLGNWIPQVDTYDPLFSVAGQGGQWRGVVEKQYSFIISIGCNSKSVLARLLLLGKLNGNRETLKGFVKKAAQTQ